METLQSAGEQMTGGARPRRPLSIQSLCTDHFRRQTPHGGFDAHRAQTGLLFSRPDLREPHTARSPVNLQHTFGTNKILPPDHSPLSGIWQPAYLFSHKSLGFQISKAL